MRDGAILRAAMEVVEAVETSGRTVDDTLRGWGRANRYAGSGDRARIGEIVYGVFRRRAECAFRMGSDGPRALVLARMVLDTPLDVDALARLCDGTGHNPTPLSPSERDALVREPGAAAPDPVRLNCPDWLFDRFDPRFDPARGLPALGARAPLDLRVNALSSARAAARAALETALAAKGSAASLAETPFSPWGLRIAGPVPASPTQRPKGPPDIRHTDVFERGSVDIQDEGSQIVSLLSGARPDMTVVDLCAGGGGKTLALAAMMDNRGRLVACDTAADRLARGRPRVDRAGIRIVEERVLQVPAPEAEGPDPDLGDLEGRADLVFVDAPCSGAGAWRRQPEARWRLGEGDLTGFTTLQGTVLARGARLVRPGGRLVYVTCSVLAAENEPVVAGFEARHAGFERIDAGGAWTEAGLGRAVPDGVAAPDASSLLLAPHLSNTDGFFFAACRRAA